MKRKKLPAAKANKRKPVARKNKTGLVFFKDFKKSIGVYYTTRKPQINLIVIILASFAFGLLVGVSRQSQGPHMVNEEVVELSAAHWLVLHRRSEKQYLYHGTPGDENRSELIRTFDVKTGVPGQKPTPLPQLMGREYWVIIAKSDSSWDAETAPYFLTLDIPITDSPPYGPADYPECEGGCNWELPGYFGLHGVNGDSARLASENLGSSGCVRHADEDITYLYDILDPTKEEIRYYIKDI